MHFNNMYLHKKTHTLTLILCSIICFLCLFLYTESFCADVSGQCSSHQTGSTCPGHSHDWETPSTCGTCNGSNSITITCNTCKGKGYTPNSLLGTSYASKKTGIKGCSCGWRGTTSQTHYCLCLTGCTNCGGSGYIYYYASAQFNTSNFTSAATKGDTAYSGYTRGSGSSVGTCNNCYSSGTYKGKNTRCTRSSCSKHGYAPWSEFLNGTGICYTDSCTPIYGSHDSNNTYQYNTTLHWTNCMYCSGTMNTASHIYGNEWTSNGYRYQSCACGYSQNNGATIYYIAYHGNGATSGSTATSTHSYHSSSYLTPNSFYRTGYSFAGWSQNPSSSSPSYYDGQAISNLTLTHGATIDLYALWTPNHYTISFHPNGGANGSLNSVTTIFHTSNYYSHGDIVPSRTGYTFLGWYTAIEGGNQVYDSLGRCVNDTGYWSENTWVYPNNLTLFAHWRRNTYTVNYLGNGGTVTTSSKTNYYNEPVDLSGVKATKSGYIFTGWNTSSNAKTPLSSYTMPNGDLNLYAIYSIPVSDISGVYLVVWPYGTPSAFRTQALQKTAAQELSYTYTISNINLSSLTGSSSNSYAIIAYDYAGNKSILFQKDPPPPLDYYVQTVHHYIYSPTSNEWIWFDTSSSLKLAGETFTPAYLNPVPTGYAKNSIDASYIVSGDRISNAYYKPVAYTITFDATGGIVSPNTKTIYYQDIYGELPIPQKEGYTFTGWYTQKDGGVLITSSSQYDKNYNSTLYAHWKVNNHIITYDYWTNGGDSVSTANAKQNYGDSIDLSITATKHGWKFVGWNTNPDATTPLSSLRLGDENLILYALFKKDITATFIDAQNKNTRTSTLTIFNRETGCHMPIYPLTEIPQWQALGWSMDTTPTATIHASAGTEYFLTNNVTFYGCYEQTLSISYDTNGSLEEIPSEQKKRLFNASGTYLNPLYTIAKAPHLDSHSFVHWEAFDTINQFVASYPSNETISLEKSLLFIAKWNQYPVIEAYDRYFTFSEAKNGKISMERLFEKVTATDKEDGPLKNGVDVTIPGYENYDFTSKPNHPITYLAKDSFGNIVEKIITVHIVDTSTSLSPVVYYPRFISSVFFSNKDSFISEEYGGLKNTSVWRTSTTYTTLLEETLKKETPIQTWTFSHEQLLQLNK